MAVIKRFKEILLLCIRKAPVIRDQYVKAGQGVKQL